MKCDFCGELVTTPAVDIVARLPDGSASGPAKRAHVPCVLSSFESGICPSSWGALMPAIDAMPELKALRSPKLRVV